MGAAGAMTPTMREVLEVLRPKRISLTDEKRTQEDIFNALIAAAAANAAGWSTVEREVRICGGIIDLLVDRVGIEVKIDGRPAEIRRQVEKYADEPSLEGLILVTRKPVVMPATLKGKPVAVLDLGRAWL